MADEPVEPEPEQGPESMRAEPWARPERDRTDADRTRLKLYAEVLKRFGEDTR